MESRQFYQPLLDEMRQSTDSHDWPKLVPTSSYTVRKMDVILRSMESISKIQFSMAVKFMFQPLNRYNVNHTKMFRGRRFIDS
jgi:hypothetical protein